MRYTSQHKQLSLDLFNFCNVLASRVFCFAYLFLTCKHVRRSSRIFSFGIKQKQYLFQTKEWNTKLDTLAN